MVTIPSTVSSQGRSIISRLAAIDWEHPKLDPDRAEAALGEHFQRLGLASLPVRWIEPTERGFSAARSVTEVEPFPVVWLAAIAAATAAGISVEKLVGAMLAMWRGSLILAEGWGAEEPQWLARAAAQLETHRRAEVAIWSTVWPLQRADMLKAVPRSAAEKAWLAAGARLDIWLPFVDAMEAGLWRFWVLDREILAVSRPSVRLAQNRLHSETGPAVQWPGGARYWFWRGVQVPKRVIEHSESLRAREIQVEPDVEVRRVMLERYGLERFIRDVGARRIHADEFGTLWSAYLPDDEPLVMVEVINSTPEPDGSFKTYMLRVPPEMQRAKQAVAWTFELTEDGYSPESQT